MRFYDPNQASSMISSHFDEFRALNAPFFFHHRFHVFAIWAKKLHFFSKISWTFFGQILKLARFEAVSKSKFLTCTWCFWYPEEAITGHSYCFTALNTPFSSTIDFIFSKLIFRLRIFWQYARKKIANFVLLKINLFVVV